MALDDPTSADQERAIATVVGSGWGTDSDVRQFVAREGGSRTSVARILSAFTPNPGAAAVASGSAVDPGMITSFALADQYADFQRSGKLDSGGRFVAPYAEPTPLAGSSIGLLPSSTDATLIAHTPDNITHPEITISDERGFVGPTGTGMVILPAAPMPTWVWFAAAAAAWFLFIRK